MRVRHPENIMTDGLNIMTDNQRTSRSQRKDRCVKCHDRHPESIMVAEERKIGGLSVGHREHHGQRKDRWVECHVREHLVTKEGQMG